MTAENTGAVHLEILHSVAQERAALDGAPFSLTGHRSAADRLEQDAKETRHESVRQVE
jgi:hypothetical protein